MKEGGGVGEGRKETLADKPLDFSFLSSHPLPALYLRHFSRGLRLLFLVLCS